MIISPGFDIVFFSAWSIGIGLLKRSPVVKMGPRTAKRGLFGHKTGPACPVMEMKEGLAFFKLKYFRN